MMKEDIHMVHSIIMTPIKFLKECMLVIFTCAA